MGVLISIVVFVLIFSLVVLIHEWGHFIMARRNGVKVEQFSLGLPPTAYTFYTDNKGTDYCIGWIPFGGYVRMYGEDSFDDKALAAKNSFAHQGKWSRTKILLAGVVMNFILAFVIFTYLFAAGTEPIMLNQADFNHYRELGLVIAEDSVVIQSTLNGSGAAVAELQGGDVVRKLNGSVVSTSQNLIEELGYNAGKSVRLLLERGEQEVDVTLQLNEEGKMGAVIADVPIIEEIKKMSPLPLPQAIVAGANQTFTLTVATVRMFGMVIQNIVTKADVPAGVVGPVGIWALTAEILEKGFNDVLKFVALISVSLGAINALPIPALDGGRFLFVVIEFFRRKPANQEWEARVHGIGFLLLLLLIIFVTYKDIIGLIAK